MAVPKAALACVSSRKNHAASLVVRDGRAVLRVPVMHLMPRSVTPLAAAAAAAAARRGSLSPVCERLTGCG